MRSGIRSGAGTAIIEWTSDSRQPRATGFYPRAKTFRALLTASPSALTSSSSLYTQKLALAVAATPSRLIKGCAQ
jgi:hypothetical protein